MVKTGFKRQKSMMSVVSKSQKSGRTTTTDEEEQAEEDDSHLFEDDDYDNKNDISQKMKNDPVLNGLTSLFQEMQSEIETRGEERFNYLNKLFSNPVLQRNSTMGGSSAAP